MHCQLCLPKTGIKKRLPAVQSKSACWQQRGSASGQKIALGFEILNDRVTASWEWRKMFSRALYWNQKGTLKNTWTVSVWQKEIKRCKHFWLLRIRKVSTSIHHLCILILALIFISVHISGPPSILQSLNTKKEKLLFQVYRQGNWYMERRKCLENQHTVSVGCRAGEDKTQLPLSQCHALTTKVTVPLTSTSP